MKNKIIIILTGVLVFSLALVGPVYAQDEPIETNPVCDGERNHPVLEGIAVMHGEAYDDLLVYFCEYEFGIGEIWLALVTQERTEGTEGEMTFEEILEWRLKENGDEEENGESIGWGEIWQELGLIGNNRNKDDGDQELTPSNNNGQNNQPQNQVENNGDNAPGRKGPQNENKDNNKPAVPPGLSGEHPGKGKGPNK